MDVGAAFAERSPAPGAQWHESIAAIASGDESALASLYDSASGLVYSLALRILRSRDDAEEVTLDVFMQVWKIAPKYDPGRGSPRAWLARLARCRAIDRLRSHSTRIKLERPLVPEFHPPSAEASPEIAALRSQDRTRILQAMQALPQEQKELVELAYYAGLTHVELAEQLGLPLGTIKTRIRSAMMAMRTAFEGRQ
jgi:RNA polymerase sigma-70 factor (ECF subfamily)